MNRPATYFVVGLASDGGRLPSRVRKDLKVAITLGLNVDCGLHNYLLQDSELSKLAVRYGIKIRDIRKPAPVKRLHFFSGKIEVVKALKPG